MGLDGAKMTQETIKVTHKATKRISAYSYLTYLKYSSGKVTRYITYIYPLREAAGPEIEAENYPGGLIWVDQESLI